MTFPTPPFPHLTYPMKPVIASTANGWATAVLGDSDWTVSPKQGTFNASLGCMESFEEFEGLQTVMAAGPTNMLNCVSYVCVTGPGADQVDVAIYPATLTGATKYQGWKGTEFADGPAVSVNGFYWYRLHVEWAAPQDDPQQDPNSVLFAKTYRHTGGGHAQPFKLWAFRHDLANMTKWYGTYTADTEGWGAYFSPLEIGIDNTLMLKGQPMRFWYDATKHLITIPKQPWGEQDWYGGGTFWGATIHFEQTDSGVSFSGTLQPREQDSPVAITGEAPATTELKLTEAQLTELATSYSIPISPADIAQLAAALPVFPPPAGAAQERRIDASKRMLSSSTSWTVGAFLGAIAGGIVGGIAGIPAGPGGIAALAGAGASAGAGIGAGLTYSAPADEVVNGIEMENEHGCCVDDRGQSYPVGWIPWLSDLKSWRNYDPTTIAGAGVLVGVRTNLDGTKSLIGRQLMTRQEEVLMDRGDDGHFSWVFTPGQAIIYRWNSGPELRAKSYIRHSQLGGGNPVICAGEFDLNDSAINIMIATINDSSGHYKPDGGKCMGPVLQKLETMGIGTTNIKVSTATEIIQ